MIIFWNSDLLFRFFFQTETGTSLCWGHESNQGSLEMVCVSVYLLESWCKVVCFYSISEDDRMEIKVILNFYAYYPRMKNASYISIFLIHKKHKALTLHHMYSWAQDKIHHILYLADEFPQSSFVFLCCRVTSINLDSFACMRLWVMFLYLSD